jgi:hypothetical protein
VLADRLALLDEHEIAGMEKVLGQGYVADFYSFDEIHGGGAFSLVKRWEKAMRIGISMRSD